jgi:hypothetical protein
MSNQPVVMSIRKFTAIFALVGFLVPLVFHTAWNFLNQSTSLDVQIIAEKIMLVVWPTSLMTLPASPEPGFETKLFMLSLGANVIVYAVLGVLVWLGLRKHIAFFAVAGIQLVAIWWWLLSL